MSERKQDAATDSVLSKVSRTDMPVDWEATVKATLEKSRPYAVYKVLTKGFGMNEYSLVAADTSVEALRLFDIYAGEQCGLCTNSVVGAPVEGLISLTQGVIATEIRGVLR